MRQFDKVVLQGDDMGLGLPNDNKREEEGDSGEYGRADLGARSLSESKPRPTAAELADLAGLLRDEKVAEFNQARRGYEADPHSLKFDRIDLSGKNLQRVNLSRCSLQYAKFVGADLRHANFASAELLASDLSESNCAEARFLSAGLSSVRFVGANLNAANLKKALCGSDFSRADLTAADFTGGAIAESLFRDAVARRAQFCAVTCAGAVFERTDLRAANFHDTNFGCYLESVVLIDCIFDEETGISEEQISQALWDERPDVPR